MSIKLDRTKISFLENILKKNIRRVIIKKTRFIYIYFAANL